MSFRARMVSVRHTLVVLCENPPVLPLLFVSLIVFIADVREEVQQLNVSIENSDLILHFLFFDLLLTSFEIRVVLIARLLYSGS